MSILPLTSVTNNLKANILIWMSKLKMPHVPFVALMRQWQWALIFVLSLLAPDITANAFPAPGNITDFKNNNINIGRPFKLTPIAVFGKDNRKFLKPKRSPITKKIGILYNQRSRTLCTAFCVDKSIIATAAHCLFGKAGTKRQKLRDFTFSLNHKKRGTTSRIEGARTNTANQHVITGATRLRVRPPIDATKDWALARLAKPVCRNGGIKLSTKKVEEVIKVSDAKKFYQVAFHRDLKKWQLAHSQTCKVNRRFGKYRWKMIRRDFTGPNKLILHNCDTGGASSGSPLIVKTQKGPEIVGINVGTYIQAKVLMRKGRITKKYKPQTVANTGVSTTVFVDLLDVLKNAKIVTDMSSMKNLQTTLKARLLYAGPVDGTYGALTRIAIEKFEKDNDWPITGLPTRALLAHFQKDIRTVETPVMSETSAAQ